MEYDRVKSLCERVTPILTGMPRGGGGGQENALVRLVELSKSIDADIDRLIDMRRDMEGIIDYVPDKTLQTLLRMRYLNGYTWERIAVEMGYCYMQVCRLHGRALELVEIPKDVIVCYTGL